ncbi:UvrD-helicase domain-containing protein [Candidatus Saccharibacteria bacterium]|nr:UvrD-helicase domain-containing protein [Candidatus Saccharibacteria bacterium]
MHEALLDGLNSEQRRAVQATDGPLLIQAGAGSGKTKTLTHRIAYLIATGEATPYSILSVTFTNKAAREMRERVWALMREPSQGESEVPRSFMPWMGTFHGICVQILRRDGEHIGIPASYVIYDEADRLSTVKRACKELHIDEKAFPARTISSYISSAKNEMIGPRAYADTAGSPTARVVAQVYPVYQTALQEAKALDFDDLIWRTVQLLEGYPDIREKWRSQFSHIMIDEYQDTNAAQYKLVKLLVNDHRNLAVVGDDWQSIYSWRGADFRNILRFEADYKDCTVIKLEQNYRSTAHILNAAHGVVSKNTQRSDKKLWTDAGDGKPVQSQQVMTERAEAEAIIRLIRQSTDAGLRTYKDFAVLYRTNAQSRTIEEAFIQYSVPYRIVGGVRFVDRAEIKDITAYLRLLYQPEDGASFNRIVNVPSRGIGPTSLQNFLAWAKIRGKGLGDALDHAGECDSIKGKAKRELITLGAVLSGLRDSIDSVPPDILIDALVKQVGYMDYLDDRTPKGESRQDNVREYMGMAQGYAEAGLGGFLEEIALISDLDSANFGTNVVTLMTVHAAKGLEFPVVCVVGLEEGIMPHARALYDQKEMEEERRLVYVAMTRARDELYLFHAIERALYGGRQHNLPSRFLAEIDAGYIQESTVMPNFGRTDFTPYRQNDSELQIERTDSFTSDEIRYLPELIEGDAVRHQLFGTGTVVEMMGDTAAIYFKGKGLKKLNIAFAPIEKLPYE